MGAFNEDRQGQENSGDKELNTSGWDAITAEFERIYPGQTKPKHYATILPMRIGGTNVLQGISIYDGGDYWHFVTYGLTELYDKESDDAEYSGFGMEFTFKLKKYDYENEQGELNNIMNILNWLANMTATKGEIFQNCEYIYTGQTEGIDAYQKSNLTGFICINDPSVNTLHTENGIVEFIEFIGMTDAELRSVSTHESVLGLYEKLGTDVTDYHRESVV